MFQHSQTLCYEPLGSLINHKVPRSLDGGDHRSKAIPPAINSCFMGLSPGAKLLAEFSLRSNQKELLLEVNVARIHGAWFARWHLSTNRFSRLFENHDLSSSTHDKSDYLAKVIRATDFKICYLGWPDGASRAKMEGEWQVHRPIHFQLSSLCVTFGPSWQPCSSSQDSETQPHDARLHENDYSSQKPP